MVTIMNIFMVKPSSNSMCRGWLWSLQDHTKGKYQNNNLGHNQVKVKVLAFVKYRGMTVIMVLVAIIAQIIVMVIVMVIFIVIVKVIVTITWSMSA